MTKNWKTKKLGSFIEFKNGLNADKGDYGRGMKFVNVMDIFANTGLREDKIMGSVSVTPKAANDYSVEYGDILFNRTSETPEDIAVSAVYLDKKPITFGGFVIRGRQFEKLLDPEYSQHAFTIDEIRREFIRRGQGAVRANIGQHDLAQVEIKIPPLAEQRRIAEILSTWDKAIVKLNALRTAKKHRFDGIAASLIHNHQTEQLYLRDILTEVSERNKGGLIKRVLSVTNSTGFVLASDQFAHRVASADISNYKVVRRGQYAYNPSRINVGSIARLDDWDDGALSPMYIVFQTRSQIDSDYFGHWLNTGEARQRIALSAQGSVRETVGFSDLGSVPIPVPSLERQSAISAALNAGMEELAYINTQIDALEHQKRGLMQKLLTGEWRVKTTKTNISISEKEIAHG